MILYTEEEVRRAIELSFGRSEDEVLAGLTPIQLPSDEDLEDMRKAYIEHINTIVHADLERDGYLNLGFHQGAKWMRDKIQGGIK